ncbi:hypothetical protein [Lysinibacillus yapensis]|nr:hypothetical protein [Lysinibacillus yapensis]
MLRKGLISVRLERIGSEWVSSVKKLTIVAFINLTLFEMKFIFIRVGNQI